MKLSVLPRPNGTPKQMGIIQWIVVGMHVHAKPSWPTGVSIAPTIMIRAAASGGGFPVTGSRGADWIILRTSGSAAMARTMPVPMPR